MNQYKTYMDRVTVSPEFHEKLLKLEAPEQSRAPWVKYTAVAACAALLLGVGVWGLGARLEKERWKDLVINFHPFSSSDGPGADADPVQCAAPSAPAESSEAIEIAPVEGDGIEPGMKTIQGYETRETRAGVDVAVYHVLPWIDYGSANEAAAVSLDWDIPEGATRRDLSGSEITTLLGGADGVNLHLDWSAYELTGWGAWYEDGTFWGAYLMGWKGPMDHFEFAVTAGQLPPTCIVFGGSVEQEIWGVTVTADKYDGKDGCSRRVSFLKDGYGYRFDLTATGAPEEAERLASRAVTYVAVGDGLNFVPFTGEETPEPSVPAENPDTAGAYSRPGDSSDFGAAPSQEPSPPGNPYAD